MKLSKKSILNMHTNLSALWTFAVAEGYTKEHILRGIKRARGNDPEVIPFTQAEVEAMVKSCAETRSENKMIVQRRTGRRDEAIIKLLLDCGLRASELTNIRLGDINFSTNSIKVLGKGSKERLVYFSNRTRKSLNEYLLPRLAEMKPDDPVFMVEEWADPHPMTRDVLDRLITRIAERAGVKGAYPHRFRHTFAIMYLRNGGDIFTLQSLLGHSSLEMVRRYARVAQVDCEAGHRKASPVDKWRL